MLWTYIFRLSLFKGSRNAFPGYSSPSSVPTVAGADPELAKAELTATSDDKPAAVTRRTFQFGTLRRFPMDEFMATKEQVVGLTADEVLRVSGGVEKEGLYPRKFGDVDYQVYVDGALIGTTYGPASPVSPDVGSGRPIDPTTNGRP